MLSQSEIRNLTDIKMLIQGYRDKNITENELRREVKFKASRIEEADPTRCVKCGKRIQSDVPALCSECV